MCVLGVEGSEKKCGLPQDNFWNSPYTCFVFFAKIFLGHLRHDRPTEK